MEFRNVVEGEVCNLRYSKLGGRLFKGIIIRFVELYCTTTLQCVWCTYFLLFVPVDNVPVSKP
jgi:hypothetical protein